MTRVVGLREGVSSHPTVILPVLHAECFALRGAFDPPGEALGVCFLRESQTFITCQLRCAHSLLYMLGI